MNGQDNGGVLWAIATNFLLMSMLGVGGVISTMPEMYRIAVETHQWMDARQFTDMFTLAQVAPGPNMLFVTLIGYQAAGVAGALVATLAIITPTALFTYVISRSFDRAGDAPWAVIIRSGLVPVSIGMMCAANLVLVQAATRDLAGYIFLFLCFGITLYFRRLHPLWVIGVGALVGIAGLV